MNGTLNYGVRKTHQEASEWDWVSVRTGHTLPWVLLPAVTTSHTPTIGVLVCIWAREKGSSGYCSLFPLNLMREHMEN